MKKKNISNYEDVTPNPEFLIKSISEQGYSLESALADLIDNSVSANANKVEILSDTDSDPFILFLADNGDGMNDNALKLAMRFPSSSSDNDRVSSDLGRFGLGMKTASFSQTRKFTVISKPRGTVGYCARTWDVELLKKGKWVLLVNAEEEIEALVKKYQQLSRNHLNQFSEFEANTIVVWQGLYKYEDYLDKENKNVALKKELTEVTAEHIEIVFHRFMERDKNSLQVKINNKLLAPFNPFPTTVMDFRKIEPLKGVFAKKSIAVEGFILPARSLDEERQGVSIWTTRYRSLMGMEGVYVYRCDRIILFGGWHRLIKKGPRLQLARLRVDIGNGIDNLINLNVAKSQLKIPFELRKGFEEYARGLKLEAEKEFYNRGRSDFSGAAKPKVEQIFIKKPSSRGVLLEFNEEFPIIENLKNNLNGEDLSQFKFLLKIINTNINKIRRVHEDKEFIGVKENDGLSLEDVMTCVQGLQNLGLEKSIIRDSIVNELGFSENSLPEKLIKLLGD